MGFVLPHLFSQVCFALDEPVPPCAVFFSLEGGSREGVGGWGEFEYCIALPPHNFIAEKKFSPLGLKQYFQLLCILLTLTLFLSEMISFADVERHRRTGDSEDFYNK